MNNFPELVPEFEAIPLLLEAGFISWEVTWQLTGNPGTQCQGKVEIFFPLTLVG